MSRFVERVWPTKGEPRAPDPLVTVVVTGVDATAAPALDGCVQGLLAQQQGDLEVVVVVPGGAAAGARLDPAWDDSRVRLVTDVPDGLGAADVGARLARGTYLAFVHPEDELPVDALRLLTDTLEASGSDFAFGRLVEAGGPERGTAPPAPPAHQEDRVGVTLGTFPEAITDLEEQNRLYRTTFWRAAGLLLPDAPDGVPAALSALTASTGFDVLSAVTCRRPASRETGADADVPGATRARLRQWLGSRTSVQAVVRELAVAAVTEAWTVHVCDVEAVTHLDAAHHLMADEWQALRAFLDALRTSLPSTGWANVRAGSRTKVWLALSDRRHELETLVAVPPVDQGNQRTTVVDGEVLAEFDRLDHVAVPLDCRTMSPRETPLRAHLHRVRRLGAGRLDLTVFTWISFVDLAGEVPEIEARLVDGTGRLSLPVPVTLEPDPQVNVVAGHRYQDYAPGCAVLSVDVPEVAARWSAGVVTLHVELTMTVKGVTRAGGLTSRESRTSPGPLGPVHVPSAVSGGRQVVVRAHPDQIAVLGVRAAPEVVLTWARSSGRRVSGALEGRAPGALHAVAGSRRVSATFPPRTDARDDDVVFELELPGGAPEASWRLLAVVEDGAERPVGYPVDTGERFLEAGPDAEVVVSRAARALAELVPAVPRLLVTGLAPVADRLEVRGRWIGPVPVRWRLTLRARATVSAEGPATGEQLTAELPLTVDEWSLGPRCLPPAVYDLTATCVPVGSSEAGDHPLDHPVDVVIAEELDPELLRFSATEHLRFAAVRSARGLALSVQPPLRADERGPYAQRLLQSWATTTPAPVEPTSVYFQSYTGEVATDSPRAVHDELWRTRPDLTSYWGVASYATPVPDGAVPVLMRSREWYGVLSTAAYLVTNIHLDHWFTSRPEQRFLETFHGYPAKAMGLSVWRSKGFSASRIALELAHSRDDWTLILTPAPEMDVHYRVEYDYAGPIEHAGYPRDDALLAGDAGAVRSRTRRLLGISEGQTVVLYAPTWRDEEAVKVRTATMTRHLDVEAASEQLGDDFVLLLRGHRFHARGTERGAASARLLDVTDYPEVNDLILASDAAVLDYSSLRFDFALTGRPMLFLVPDLDDYRGGRGFLFPFEESAPGPLLRDTDEVVATLRDLPAVAEQYAEEYAAFQRRFNYLQDGRAAQRVAARFFA